MKILSVKGSGLAALRHEFSVSFEDGPIAAAGVFGIVGPTGAGKSTLLDAICLALYGKFPRLQDGDANSYIGDPSGEKLRHTDAATIVSRGAIGAMAEVRFLGRDGNVYRAVWSIRRARARKDGVFQPAQHAVFDAANERVAGTTTASEARSAIASQIGLTFDQFRRSVMLAQNDFQAFIKADVRERATLLERLTGTEIYTEISKAAFANAAAFAQDIATLRIQRDAIGAPARPVGELIDAKQTAESRVSEGEASIKLAGDKIVWLDRRDFLQGNEKAASDAYAQESGLSPSIDELRENARRRVNADEIAELIALVERAAQETSKARQDKEKAAREHQGANEKSAQASIDCERAGVRADHADTDLHNQRPAIARAKIIDGQIAAEIENERIAAEAVTEITADCAANEVEADRLETQRVGLESEIQVIDKWISEHPAAQAVAAGHHQIDDALARLAATNVELNAHNKARDLAQAEISSAEAEKSASELAFAEIDKEVKHLRSRKAVQAVEIRDAQTILSAWFDEPRLLRVEAALVEVEAAQERHRDAVVRCTAAQALQNDKSKAQTIAADLVAQANDAKREAERDEDAVKTALEGCLKLIDDSAKRLRESLKPGDTCPVCGSKEHRMETFAQAFDVEIAALKEKHAKAKTTLQGCGETLSAAESQLQGAELALAGAMAGLEAAGHEAARLKVAFETATDALVSCNDGGTGEIAERLMQVRADLDRGRQESERISNQTSQLRQIELDLDKRVDEANSLQASISNAIAKTLDLQKHKSAADLQVQAICSAKTGHLEALKPFFAGADLETMSHTDIDAIRSVVAQAELRIAGRSEKTQAVLGLQKSQDENRVQSAALRAKRDARQSQLDAVNVRLGELRAQRATALVKTDAMQFEADLVAAVDDARTSLTAARKAESDARSVAAKTESDWRAAQAVAAREVAAHERAEAELVAAEEALALTRADATQALMILAKVDDIEAEITRRISAISAAKARFEDAQRDRFSHGAQNVVVESREDLKRLIEQFTTNIAQARDERDLLVAEIASGVESAKRAADLDKDIAERMEKSKITNEINDLIGSRDGAAFRKVAQRLTLSNLVRLANQHLLDMAPRYVLRAADGDDLALSAIDLDMANEERAVSNLSGGEKFLVSLAMARGLADLSSNRGVPIDSMFIDEGFGSLDARSLTIVMTALEKLQASGRMVGIISHIEAVHERLACKVVVAPDGGGESRVAIAA